MSDVHLVRRDKMTEIPFVIQEKLCTELNPKLKQKFDVQIEASRTGASTLDVIGTLIHIGQAKETIEKAAWDLYYDHASSQKKCSRNILDFSEFDKWQALKYIKFLLEDRKVNRDEPGEIKFGKDKEVQKAVEEHLANANGCKLKSKSGKITISNWPVIF